jgi:hypothetical protein
MARRARQPSVVRWVTKLVTRGGKQFRQRFRVAEKVAKKLGRRVAKRARVEHKAYKSERARAKKKAENQRARQQARAAKRPAKKAAKPSVKPTWREILVEGKRSWIRMGSGGLGSAATGASKRAAALKTLQQRGQQASDHSKIPGLGKWQKTGENRHLKHKDYAAPHAPAKKRRK